VNLIPVFGAILLGWGLVDILLLYWSESAAIGFYTLLKLAIYMWNQKEPGAEKKKGFFAPINRLFSKFLGMVFILGFFTIHFGGFMVGHLIFILAIFLPFEPGKIVENSSLLGFDILAIFYPILFGTLAFFISHGVSFVKNFILAGEYKTADMNIMLTPYPRIVIMQVAIIVGLVFTAWMIPLGIPPLGPILIIIAAKTFSDVAGHMREHRM
jgi:hypothetical protein